VTARLDLEVGEVFGNLAYVRDVASLKGKRRCEFKCICGVVKSYTLYKVTSGKAKSCGCYNWRNPERSRERHSMSRRNIYKVWRGLINRCYNKNQKSYKTYGGRGITVSSVWAHSPSNFFDWAVNNGYKEGLQIDRKDVDGNYEPANCRFIECKENCYGRRAFGEVKYKGVVKSGKRFVSRIMKDGIHYQLGTFETAEDAAKVYNEKAKELYGEFAYINIIKKVVEDD